jgi:zinc protease
VDQLVQAAREEIEIIRKKGPSAEEIEKFIATENRQREVALRTNRFWLNYLKNVYSQDKDIYSVLNFNDELESIKRKKVKKAGRSLLSTDGNLELYLFPEALKPETKVY